MERVVGIDYGMGKTNRDPKNGIRYGVLPAHDVIDFWAEASEAVCAELEIECPECKEHIAEGQLKLAADELACPNCGADIEGELDCAREVQEPDGYKYEKDGIEAYQRYDDTDIFITKSPYYTYANLCSPCAPGAGHLRQPLLEPCEGNRTYCAPASWYENEEAPYPVYFVGK